MDQWLRRKLTSAGALLLAGFIFAGVFGVDTRQTLAFQIFSLLAALLLLAFISSLIFRGRFSIVRELPDYCTVAQPMKYRVTLSNHTSRAQENLSIAEGLSYTLPSFSEFTQQAAKETNVFDRYVGLPRWLKLVKFKIGASIPVKAIPSVPAQGQSTFYIDMLPERRGYIHFSHATLRHPEPLGLANAYQNINQADRILVLPKRYQIPPISLPGPRRYQPGGLHQTGSVGDSQEFASLRDYRAGDPIKHIYWPRFAKYAAPVVKEYQEEFFVRMGLVLDTFIEDRNEALFEEAVAIAASFISARQNNDVLLDLIFIGNEAHCLGAGRHPGNVHHMLEILACVQACHNQPFTRLSSLIISKVSLFSTLICILLAWDQSRQDLIARLCSLGIPVLIIVLEEATEIRHAPGPMQDHASRFHVLYRTEIQAGLRKITWS